MNVSKQEIQFIDTYLQKHDVVFVDIRAEMVDHIAAAVEEKMATEGIDFYDAFKSYMIANSKAILKNNKENWYFSLSQIKNFFFFLVKPQMLVVFGLLLAVAKLLEDNKSLNYFIQHSSHYFMHLIIFIALIELVYFWFILKKRFYYIEKNGQLLLILYWINLIFFDPFDKIDNTNFYGAVVFLYLFLGYFLFSINHVRNFFKLKLNRL